MERTKLASAREISSADRADSPRRFSQREIHLVRVTDGSEDLRFE
jgi:hypothetical protein